MAPDQKNKRAKIFRDLEIYDTVKDLVKKRATLTHS